MMTHLFKILTLSFIGLIAFTVTSCGDDEPNNSEKDGSNPPGQEEVTDDTYFDEIQGLWMMVRETNLKTNQTVDLDGYSYKYCYIYSEDGETLYGQYISYPSMSKGKKIEITLKGDEILSNDEVIGSIIQCGAEGSSKIELVVEWEANQDVFNPNSYKIVAYYYRDTWSSL